VLDTSSQELWYDPDGDQTGGDEELIATIQTMDPLLFSSADVEVV
jgi:hypothetical protein